MMDFGALAAANRQEITRLTGLLEAGLPSPPLKCAVAS